MNLSIWKRVFRTKYGVPLGSFSDGTVVRWKLVIVSGVIATVGYVGIATVTQPIQAFIAGPITVALAVVDGKA